MPFGYIYKIEFPNGKVYIGLTTTSLEHRKAQHKSKAKKCRRYLYNALRKYNMVDTLELIKIDTADTKEELCEKEMRYIQMYRSLEREYGYNRTLGGDGVSGYVFTEEDRKKMSEAIKKAYEKPEAREKLSEALKKYFETPGAREKMSEIKKTHFAKPEAREKLSEAQKKRFDKPGEREKMSETKKKYHEENPDAGIKHGENMKKHYNETPGAREKMSEALKKYHEENPDAGIKHSENVKNYYNETPGAREKLSEAMKKYHEKNPDAGIKHGEKLKKYFEKPGAKQYMLDKRGKNKPFDVFTKDGTFVKTFTYQIDAREYLQKEYGITSTIKSSEVLKGHCKSSRGFVFKYKD
tara:strand:- start:15 stop:1073 length:1059 start_codon:yes stop_codon:yes gene_type:complete